MSITEPLLDDVPSPVNKVSKPPVLAELRPLVTEMCPPLALVPLPMLNVMLPLRPDVELAEPSNKDPPLPPIALPVLKVSLPLIPELPEFTL
mmetsp:Transcript_14939/g.19794  ORF Transcript_14939/g.19794 Transcript_14939/m.19794 type:complete len:92 (-) Transcript_14939:2503-2778(-)